MFRSVKPLVLLARSSLHAKQFVYGSSAQEATFSIPTVTVRMLSTVATTKFVFPPSLQVKFYEEWESNHRHKQRSIVTIGDEHYEGEMHFNKRQGFGKFISNNRKTGMVYVGYWANNLPNGYGEAKLNSGSEYIGEWKEGVYHGQGRINYRDGGYYEGQWEHGQKHGHGVDVSQEGARYEGNFVNHKKHGKGSLTLPNGSIYVGDIVEGRMEGTGTFTSTDGTVYVGEYHNNKQHGQGKITYAKGGTYVGSFQHGRRNGLGTATSPKGDVSSGTFVDNVLQGPGELKLANGRQVLKGEFVNGQLVRRNDKNAADKDKKVDQADTLNKEVKKGTNEARASTTSNIYTSNATGGATRSSPKFKFQTRANTNSKHDRHDSHEKDENRDSSGSRSGSGGSEGTSKRPEWLA